MWRAVDKPGVGWIVVSDDGDRLDFLFKHHELAARSTAEALNRTHERNDRDADPGCVQSGPKTDDLLDQ